MKHTLLFGKGKRERARVRRRHRDYDCRLVQTGGAEIRVLMGTRSSNTVHLKKSGWGILYGSG